MQIGIPKEIKDQEGRVALTPPAVAQLIAGGHQVLVEVGAGEGAGFTDHEYQASGARLTTASEAWDTELVVKVKEPLVSEYPYLRGQILFTYLHLAGTDPSLTETLLRQKTTGIAYETVEDAKGTLPLLAPMSAIAGNMAAQVGAWYLAQPQGGKGVQLGRIRGGRHGRVLIIGDGTVAYHAAISAHGLGAEVVMVGLAPARGRIIEAELGRGFTFVPSTQDQIVSRLAETDLLIGAVLRKGARAEYVVDEQQIRLMRPGSVVVDVSIDQGGCFATSRPTSHSRPTYTVHDIIHYCVTNMPGAYPRTATEALTAATLPYVLQLARLGIDSLRQDAGFARGLNTWQGAITAHAVAESMGLLDQYRPFNDLL